jgi:hypothetical protein
MPLRSVFLPLATCSFSQIGFVSTTAYRLLTTDYCLLASFRTNLDHRDATKSPRAETRRRREGHSNTLFVLSRRPSASARDTIRFGQGLHRLPDLPVSRPFWSTYYHSLFRCANIIQTSEFAVKGKSGPGQVLCRLRTITRKPRRDRKLQGLGRGPTDYRLPTTDNRL